MYLFTRQKGEQDLARAEGPKGSPSKKQSFNKDDSNMIPEHKKRKTKVATTSLSHCMKPFSCTAIRSKIEMKQRKEATSRDVLWAKILSK